MTPYEQLAALINRAGGRTTSSPFCPHCGKPMQPDSPHGFSWGCSACGIEGDMRKGWIGRPLTPAELLEEAEKWLEPKATFSPYRRSEVGMGDESKTLYLGDGVYATVEPAGIRLDRGPQDPAAQIFLDVAVFQRLVVVARSNGLMKEER